MKPPTRQEISAEAIKLFHERNTPLDNYNSPEREELQEAGLLVEARDKLMTTRIRDLPPPSKQIGYSSEYVIEMTEQDGVNWVAEWMKKDPHLLDTEGFEKFMEQKQNEIPVIVSVDSDERVYGGHGYYIHMEIPPEGIPDRYKNASVVQEKKGEVAKVADRLTEALKKIGYGHRERYMPPPLVSDEEVLDAHSQYSKDVLRPGSTSIFLWQKPEKRERAKRTFEKEEILKSYVHGRLSETRLFFDKDLEDSWYEFADGGSTTHENPDNLVNHITSAVWGDGDEDMQKDADELIDKAIESRFPKMEEGMWYYYGDEKCGEDNIRENAKILWKIWKAVGSKIGTDSVHKNWDARDLYLKTTKADAPELPPFSVCRHRGVMRDLKFNCFQYEHEVRLVELEEPEGEVWSEIENAANVLLKLDNPNTEEWDEESYVWVQGDDPMPVMSCYKATLKEVEAFLKEGKVEWNPEDVIDRNGGLELVHPFLRKPMTLAWTPENVAWSKAAAIYREMFLRQYKLEELEAKKVSELSLICRAKGISVVRRKPDMIDGIIEGQAQDLDFLE